MRIFHPAVIKIAAALRKLFYEITHAFPCAVAKSFGFSAVLRYKNVSLAYIARMLYRIFVFLYKVVIARLSYSGYFYVYKTSITANDDKYNFLNKIIAHRSDLSESVRNYLHQRIFKCRLLTK